MPSNSRGWSLGPGLSHLAAVEKISIYARVPDVVGPSLESINRLSIEMKRIPDIFSQNQAYKQRYLCLCLQMVACCPVPIILIIKLQYYILCIQFNFSTIQLQLNYLNLNFNLPIISIQLYKSPQYGNRPSQFYFFPQTGSKIFISSSLTHNRQQINQMGQAQGTNPNPALQQWHRNPQQPTIYTNKRTGEQVQAHSVVLRKSEQIIMKKRIQQSHNFVTRVLYFEPAELTNVVKEQMRFNVYTERLYKLSHQTWVPINSALSILKGFRRLSSSYGPMRVTRDMARVNNKKQIRAWINQSPIKNQVSQSTESQKQMITDIVKIISELDNKLGSILTGSLSFNQAINSIISSMTSFNVSHSHISSKTSKNQEKPSFLAGGSTGGPKNNFRSTKETQDNQIKPITQNDLSKEKKSHNNYLNNVHVPRPPMYVDVSAQDSKSMILPSGQRKMLNENSINHERTNYNNFSHNLQIQKIDESKINNSYPHTKVSPIKSFKPVELKTIADTYSYGPSHQLTPSYSRTLKQADKFKQILHRVPTQPARQQPNISKTNTLFTVASQYKYEKRSYSKVNTISQNEKSEANTSREYQQSQLFLARRYPITHLLTPPPNENRDWSTTQQFYQQNTKNDLTYAPRFKTNYLPTTANNVEIQTSKPSISQSQIHSNAQKQRGFKASSTPNKARPLEQNEESQMQEQKKFQKIKQAQKIKQEMSCLGLENTNSSKLLANDKSARDLLIKKKVEEKNRKHKDLKSAISKLLKQ